MIHIQYDNREKFPWLLWAGSFVYKKYRTHKGALNGKAHLEKAVRSILND